MSTEPTAPAMTEPGCQHPLCTLEHPHAGPAILSPLGQLVHDRTAAAAADPAAAGDEPTPVAVAAGTFVIYQDGKGGYVLVTETAAGVDRRHIPGAVVKLMTGGGIIGRKFAAAFGGGAA